jgi:hypothetical protein
MLQSDCRIAPLRVAKLYKTASPNGLNPEPEFHSVKATDFGHTQPSSNSFRVLMRKREADYTASRGDSHVLNPIHRVTHR